MITFWLAAAGVVLSLAAVILSLLAHQWAAMWIWFGVLAFNLYALWLNRKAVP